MLVSVKQLLTRKGHHKVEDGVQVYTRLQERLGLKDHAMILNVMLSKIAINLKVYGSCDDIITLTLNLFQVRPAPSPVCSSRFPNTSEISTIFGPQGMAGSLHRAPAGLPIFLQPRTGSHMPN